jgi:hypothetical protein
VGNYNGLYSTIGKICWWQSYPSYPNSWKNVHNSGYYRINLKQFYFSQKSPYLELICRIVTPFTVLPLWLNCRNKWSADINEWKWPVMKMNAYCITFIMLYMYVVIADKSCKEFHNDCLVSCSRYDRHRNHLSYFCSLFLNCFFKGHGRYWPRGPNKGMAAPNRA